MITVEEVSLQCKQDQEIHGWARCCTFVPARAVLKLSTPNLTPTPVLEAAPVCRSFGIAKSHPISDHSLSNALLK
jgi:hypothetical protein